MQMIKLKQILLFCKNLDDFFFVSEQQKVGK